MARVLIFVLMALLLDCADSPAQSQLDNASAKGSASSAMASDEDQREILSTLVAVGEYGPPPPPPSGPDQVRREARATLVLLEQPVAFCATSVRHLNDECAPEIERSDLTPIEADLSGKDVAEFWQANTETSLVIHPPIRGAVAANRKFIDALLENPDGWRKFRDLYSSNAGILSATRAVLSHGRQHALIYVAYRCGKLCGYGYVHVLVRSNGAWRLKRSYQVWVS